MNNEEALKLISDYTLRFIIKNDDYNNTIINNIEKLFNLISKIINEKDIIDLSNKLITNYRNIPSTSTLDNTYNKLIEYNNSNIEIINNIILIEDEEEYDALTAYDNNNDKKIYFNNQNQLEDIAILIHEISHYNNLSNSTIRNLITEAIAYTDELIYLDSINDKDIKIQEFKTLVNDLYDTYCLLLPIYFQKKYKGVNVENYIKEYNNDSNYLIDIKRTIELINNEDYINHIINNAFGFIFMPYIYDNKLNNIDISNINTLEELFNIYNINGFDDNKLLLSIDNYINSTKNLLEMYIVFGPDLTRDQLISIDSLDRQVYDEKYLWDDITAEKMRSKIDDGLITLTVNNKVIGYIWALNITKEAYDHTKISNTLVDDYKEYELLPIEDGKDLYLTINSIVIDPIYQDGDAIIYLSNAFLELIESLSYTNNIKGINATCVSPDGEKIVKRLGLSFYKDNNDGTKLYIKE